MPDLTRNDCTFWVFDHNNTFTYVDDGTGPDWVTTTDPQKAVSGSALTTDFVGSSVFQRAFSVSNPSYTISLPYQIDAYVGGDSDTGNTFVFMAGHTDQDPNNIGTVPRTFRSHMFYSPLERLNPAIKSLFNVGGEIGLYVTPLSYGKLVKTTTQASAIQLTDGVNTYDTVRITVYTEHPYFTIGGSPALFPLCDFVEIEDDGSTPINYSDPVYLHVVTIGDPAGTISELYLDEFQIYSGTVPHTPDSFDLNVSGTTKTFVLDSIEKVQQMLFVAVDDATGPEPTIPQFTNTYPFQSQSTTMDLGATWTWPQTNIKYISFWVPQVISTDSNSVTTSYNSVYDGSITVRMADTLTDLTVEQYISNSNTGGGVLTTAYGYMFFHTISSVDGSVTTNVIRSSDESVVTSFTSPAGFANSGNWITFEVTVEYSSKSATSADVSIVLTNHDTSSSFAPSPFTDTNPDTAPGGTSNTTQLYAGAVGLPSGVDNTGVAVAKVDYRLDFVI